MNKANSICTYSFFNQMDRLFQPDYVPTDADIIHCRIKTTGNKNIKISGK